MLVGILTEHHAYFAQVDTSLQMVTAHLPVLLVPLERLAARLQAVTQHFGTNLSFSLPFFFVTNFIWILSNAAFFMNGTSCAGCPPGTSSIASNTAKVCTPCPANDSSCSPSGAATSW